MMKKEIQEKIEKHPIKSWLSIMGVGVFLLGSALCAILLVIWLGKAFWKVLNFMW